MTSSILRPSKIRRTAGIAAILALGSLPGLAGCGPSSNETAPAAVETTTPGETTASAPTEPAAKANAGPRRDRVVFAPSASNVPAIEYDPITGRTFLRAADIKSLLRYAYSINPKQIEIEIPIDLRRRYNARIEPATPSLLHVRTLLQDRLDREFNMTVTREQRVVPVFLMERIDGSVELPASVSRNRIIRNTEGRFEGKRATMADLAHFATLISYKPVLDRTELRGTYDMVVEWDSSAGTAAAHKAFRDLGLRLVAGEAPVSFLVVRRRANESAPVEPATP